MEHLHWADEAAARVLETFPGLLVYTVAAGITPSGVAHIGNFREVITAELVARALAARGVPVRFIFSWDDFDVFRKVPEDMPGSLDHHLGRSLTFVPDSYGCHPSYADHHIQVFEESLRRVGIMPEFIRQSQKYQLGTYAEGIHRTIQQRDQICEILNHAREEATANTHLGNSWTPIAGFCGACGHDKVSYETATSPLIHVRCSRCFYRCTMNLQRGARIKLPWRLDWPMRWAFEQVCFEAGGKDHSSAGGSFDTAKVLVQEVYGWKPPVYLGYDFVRIKGQGGKISSSKGNVVTVDDCLEVYEPEVLRWIFVSRRPDTEFQISFDFVDVIKIYEEYDKAHQLALVGNTAAQRIIALSSLDGGKTTPREGHRSAVPVDGPLPSFRSLIQTVQLYEGDLDRIVAHCDREGELAPTSEAHLRCRRRAACVLGWLARFGAEQRFALRAEPIILELSADQTTCLRRLVLALLVLALEAGPTSEAELVPTMRTLCAETALSNKTFLPLVYGLLLGQERGPKLTSLVMAAGPARILALLLPSLP